METPENNPNMKIVVDDEKVLDSKKQMDAKMSAAINTCLEFDMAFKLMSYRVATTEMFLQRCLNLAEFLLAENKRISDEGGED